MSHLLTESSSIIAPYITTWSTEEDQPAVVVERAGWGIGYLDETPIDRDGHGVLWHRTHSQPRIGRPEFGMIHPLRQRRAMRRLLCQVCAGPADQNEDGVLWLLQDHRGDWDQWPEGMAVTEPPICLPCVHTSVRLCPALRKGAAVLRARDFSIAGVHGTLYKSGRVLPVKVKETIVALDDPGIRWVRAVHLLRELRGCTFVSTEELAAAAGVHE